MIVVIAALLMTALADDPGYAKGRELYGDFEYEQALIRFQAVSVRPELAPTERADVLVWIALCFEGVGRKEDADQALRDAVSLDATVKLPVATSPDFGARFAAIAAEETTAPPPPPPPPPAPPPGPGPPLLAIGVGGSAALLASAGFGFFAVERWGASTNPALFVDERADAHSTYTLALGAAIVGALAATGLFVGAGLALLAPASPDAATGSGG